MFNRIENILGIKVKQTGHTQIDPNYISEMKLGNKKYYGQANEYYESIINCINTAYNDNDGYKALEMELF